MPCPRHAGRASAYRCTLARSSSAAEETWKWRQHVDTLSDCHDRSRQRAIVPWLLSVKDAIENCPPELDCSQYWLQSDAVLIVSGPRWVLEGMQQAQRLFGSWQRLKKATAAVVIPRFRQRAIRLRKREMSSCLFRSFDTKASSFRT